MSEPKENNTQPNQFAYPQPVYQGSMSNPFNGYYYYPANMQPPQNNREQIMKMRAQEADRIVPEKSGMPWSSIILKPNLVFETQDPNEKVYVLVRAHWITNLGWFLRNLFLSILPFILFPILVALGINIDISFISNKALTIIGLLYYSFIFTSVVSNFIDWYFDPFIVTDQRIMDYDYKPYGNYSVSEVNLQDVQDVKERSAGLIGDIFNYGNVFVYSASDASEMICKNVPSPTKVRDIITDLSNVAKAYKYDSV
jgi:hypothetical protein